MALENWQARLGELLREFQVPGAVVAVGHGSDRHVYAAGVSNTATGAAMAPDMLFQIGSVTKVWTATQIMLLASEGSIGLDAPIAGLLPGFRVADPLVSSTVTVRQLLTHTSGIEGDLFLDTGDDDGCVGRYVEACADLPQIFPPGAGHSYCNAGYVILGRIVERVTKERWDRSLRDLVIEPLGLTHTHAPDEDVRRVPRATGHVYGAGNRPVGPMRYMGFGRSIGPAGLISARAADLVEFGSAHLPGGRFDFPEMRVPEVTVPNPYGGGAHWGLGWALDTWSGHRVMKHLGFTIGQSALLCVVPDTGTVVCLFANRDSAHLFLDAALTEVLAEIGEIEVPPPPRPPSTPVPVEVSRLLGTYERSGLRLRVAADGRQLVIRDGDPQASSSRPKFPETRLTALDDMTFVARSPHGPGWTPYVFYTLATGVLAAHFSVRTIPRVTRT